MSFRIMVLFPAVVWDFNSVGLASMQIKLKNLSKMLDKKAERLYNMNCEVVNFYIF
jgi:hypothetical protein